MPGTWWSRFVVIVGVFLWCLWMLTPTLLGESQSEILQEQAEAAQAAASGKAANGSSDQAGTKDQAPWWRRLLPEKRIAKGLDIQGGIDMTLQVGVDEAVISSVQREIKPLREAADKAGVKLDEVRREPGEATLLIRPGSGVTLSDVTAFIQSRYSTYQYVNTRTIDGKEYYAFQLTERQADYIKERAVQQALETIRNRIDETGVKEPSIVLKGGDQINIQLPGVENPEEAVQAVGTTAVLEFMMVDEEAMKNVAGIERALVDAEKALPPATYLDDKALNAWMLENQKIPPGDRLLWEYKKDPKTGKEVRDQPYIVKDEVILTGDDINDAHTAMNQYNEPYVALEFKAHGAKVFAEVTAENVGRRFAIVLDNKVKSAPVIREKISGGRASIEMGTADYQTALNEAKVLSLVLRTGALPAPVTVGQIRQVGASLGADAIKSGTEATFIGFGLVLFFMLLYYRRSGIVAVGALIYNIVMVMALLAVAGATLTLPGVAGIALTVGMAVDANIIIYERIREELRTGKNARAAVEAGFEKALWAVLDGNITTFIAGVVLYTYGTGPIKGFAVTLMIGIISTLFTGIFVSRTFMNLLSRKATARLSI